LKQWSLGNDFTATGGVLFQLMPWYTLHSLAEKNTQQAALLQMNYF